MLQNRVNPFGEIVAVPARGTFMGNRGVIHNPAKNIVRPFKHKAWITCALHFKGRHREVMMPDRWTELFFLDEVTAFAAGHRPCCECRRENYNLFKRSWLKGNPSHGFQIKTSINEIDKIIHQERIALDHSKITYRSAMRDLPNGTFIARDSKAFLVAGGRLHRWSPEGYGEGVVFSKTDEASVLTPRSIVNAFLAGYPPQFQLH